MNITKIYFSNIKPLSFKSNFKQQSLPIERDEFVRSTGSIDIARIKDLGISHFRLIDSNSVRGVTLANQKPEILRELKECGIETIIDLRSEGSDKSKYAKVCKDNGLEYMNYKLKINIPIFNPPMATKQTTEERNIANKKFISQLPTFFDTLNKGKVYMACLLGLHRTDLAVTLNYLINPREPETPPTLSHMFIKEETNFTNKYIGAIKNLIKNLSKEDIQTLNLSENFQNIFDARVLKLRMMNLAK